jgi:hypothetical protein
MVAIFSYGFEVADKNFDNKIKKETWICLVQKNL